ncbi:Diphthamide biosynthesis protein 4 [Boothiomyces macroporosus]|uniref:Diphthamide biosynthesis protein 4 n=1 Tax=Boothiomyces macroporosus TaxID=261099 RepID=A0AAD5UGD4_9FUNG|nr:Diphthamide biosynthesis protein 4 [Boothiomyces macroporosus]
MNYYERLDIKDTASLKEIRQAYQQLCLKVKPKLTSFIQIRVNTTPKGFMKSSKVSETNAAYQVLSDTQKRFEYDQLLRKSNLAGAVQADVDLDDMEYNDENSTYRYDCRCGGMYIVTEDQLEDGIAGVECNQCSLCVKLHYQLAEEE